MADISAAVDKLKDGVTEASRQVAAALPLWVIIVIVVVGTGLLALLVGLCCLCLCRRRRGRKAAAGGGDDSSSTTVLHGYPDATAAPSSDGGGGGGSRNSSEGARRHKLRKRPPSSLSSSSSSSSFGNGVDDRGVEVEEVELGRGEPEFRNMAMAPARKASLLAIPPLLTGLRASIVSIGGGRRLTAAGRGSGGGGLNISNSGAASNWHRRRTSEAWIDDDALHGPEVSPTKRSSAATAVAARRRSRSRSRMKSWGASIRESWPLKTPSPTLPSLPHFGPLDAGVESVALFQFNNKDYDGAANADADADADGRFVPSLPPPLGAAARQQRDVQLSPPRQLPKPPSQALLAANANTAGLRPVGSLYGTTTSASNSPRGRGLSYYKYEDTDQPVKSSGSPRSKVQRGVGVGTGVVGPRGRGPSADSTMTQILKDTEKRLQDGAATGVATRNRSSSSPQKRTPQLGLGPDAVTVALVRSRSRTPSPAKVSSRAHGAAPSHARQGSQASFASEPDSLFDDPSPSLPYHGLTSPSRSKPSQQSSPHRRRPSLVPSFTSSASSLSTIHSETEEALTPNTTAPNSSIPFGMNQIAGLGDPFMPSKTSTPASKKPQGPGSASRGAQDSGNRSHKRDRTHNARSDSPLSPVTGNMRSPDATPTRGANRSTTAKGADSAEPGPPTTPGRSPTKASDRGTPVALFKRLSDLAPPFRSRDETPEVSHPSPALPNASANARLSSVYDFYAAMPESSKQDNNNNNMNTNNKWRRAGGGQARMVSSSAASVSSSLYSDTSAAERERERQNAALSRISMLLNQEIGQQQIPLPNNNSSRPKPTVRAVSQNFNNHQQQQQGAHQHGAGDARVSATLAAVAELRRMNSQVSAYSAAGASTYSDTSSLAAAANIRPESVVPPRGGAAAARNYLALGSPVKSSPDREVRGRYEVGCDDDDDALTPTRNNNNRRLGMGRRAGSVERGGSSGSGSGSEDGASLYDQDGFYITPARRHGLKF